MPIKAMMGDHLELQSPADRRAHMQIWVKGGTANDQIATYELLIEALRVHSRQTAPGPSWTKCPSCACRHFMPSSYAKRGEVAG